MLIDQTQREYYNRRAQEYEKVYAKPERQTDIALLRDSLNERFRAQQVLEVACGTAFWTPAVARNAASVVASDQSEETLQIARAKDIRHTRFVQDDAYTLNNVDSSFNAAFAGFWWSHIPKARIGEFLKTLHSRLEPGARVVFADNQYVEGSNTPISRRDAEGNTYQLRNLDDGTQFEILKNFPSDAELRASFAEFSNEIEIQRWNYFWLVQYFITK